MEIVGKLGLALIAFWASGMVADYLKAGLYPSERRRSDPSD